MKDLTKGNIYKTFFLFGFPLVLSGLLGQTYGIVDTAIAGKFLGDTGLAAIGATAPLIEFIAGFFWGYGVGASIYTARLFAAKNYKKLKSVIYSTFLLFFLFYVILAVTLISFHDQVFAFLKINEELHEFAFKYFAVYVGGFFFIAISTLSLFFLTSFGIGSFSFYMSLISTVFNIGGNLLTIVALGMGVEGLALASVVSATVVDICYFIKLKKCFKEMGLQKQKAHVGIQYVRHSLPYALPNMAQQTVMYFAGLLISPLVNGLGVAAAASYSVVMRVYNLNATVYQNSSRSVSNYTAQCVGQDKINKINKGVFAGLLQGVAFVLPFILTCCIFYKPICSLFFKADADVLTKEYAYLFARKYLPFVVLNLACNLFHGLFRGAKATGHLFATTFTGAFSQYVLSVLLVARNGMNGFFLAWILSWAIEAVLCFALYFIGRWKPKKAE